MTGLDRGPTPAHPMHGGVDPASAAPLHYLSIAAPPPGWRPFAHVGGWVGHNEDRHVRQVAVVGEMRPQPPEPAPQPDPFAIGLIRALIEGADEVWAQSPEGKTIVRQADDYAAGRAPQPDATPDTNRDAIPDFLAIMQSAMIAAGPLWKQIEELQRQLDEATFRKPDRLAALRDAVVEAALEYRSKWTTFVSDEGCAFVKAIDALRAAQAPADPLRVKLAEAFKASDMDCSLWCQAALEKLADIAIAAIEGAKP